MKALYNMKNEEKGRQLFALFPGEFLNFSMYVQQCYHFLKDNEAELRDQFTSDQFTFDDWLAYAGEVSDEIRKNNSKLSFRTWYTVEKIFQGRKAAFTIDRVKTYVGEGGGSDKFRMAANLLLD